MSEFAQYFSELRTELNKLPSRAAKGALLERAFQIPLLWPPSEYPTERTLAEQFQRALTPWGGKVHIVKSEDEAVPKVAELIQEAKATRGSRWICPRLNRFDWEKGLAHLNLEWIIPNSQELQAGGDEGKRREMIERMEKIEVGLTDCDLAVAHTGSLVFRHSSERNGYVNLFPWTHIAIVWISQVVKTVQEAIENLEASIPDKKWSANTVFVTGPSRSGDIDLTVGQGAAGPGRFHVILIDRPENENNG